MSAPTDIVIRAERPDQPDVRALLSELDAYLMTLYEPDHNHILDVQALLDSNVAFFVARDCGVAIGCGAARIMPGEVATAGQAYGEIKRMFVATPYRGRRIAQRLLADLEAALRARGIGLALLETGDRQPEALRLYERCGYAARTPFGGYEENGTSVFYAKVLG